MTLVVDVVFLDTSLPSSQYRGRQGKNPRARFDIPLVLQAIPQLEDFDFNPPLAIMLQDFRVWLSLTVLERLERVAVWVGLIPNAESGEVALDIARGAGAARRGETNIGRHVDEVAKSI